MKHPTSDTVTSVALLASLGINAVAILAALTRGELGAAGAQTIVLLVVLTVWWTLPLLHRILDAKLAEARAGQHTAEIVLGAVERQICAGAQVAWSLEGRGKPPVH